MDKTEFQDTSSIASSVSTGGHSTVSKLDSLMQELQFNAFSKETPGLIKKLLFILISFLVLIITLISVETYSFCHEANDLSERLLTIEYFQIRYNFLLYIATSPRSYDNNRRSPTSSSFYSFCLRLKARVDRVAQYNSYTSKLFSHMGLNYDFETVPVEFRNETITASFNYALLKYINEVEVFLKIDDWAGAKACIDDYVTPKCKENNEALDFCAANGYTHLRLKQDSVLRALISDLKKAANSGRSTLYAIIGVCIGSIVLSSILIIALLIWVIKDKSYVMAIFADIKIDEINKILAKAGCIRIKKVLYKSKDVHISQGDEEKYWARLAFKFKTKKAKKHNRNISMDKLLKNKDVCQAATSRAVIRDSEKNSLNFSEGTRNKIPASFRSANQRKVTDASSTQNVNAKKHSTHQSPQLLTPINEEPNEQNTQPRNQVQIQDQDQEDEQDNNQENDQEKSKKKENKFETPKEINTLPKEDEQAKCEKKRQILSQIDSQLRNSSICKVGILLLTFLAYGSISLFLNYYIHSFNERTTDFFHDLTKRDVYGIIVIGMLREIVYFGDKLMIQKSPDPEKNMFLQDYIDELFKVETRVSEYSRNGDRTIFSTYFDLANRLETAEFCNIVDSYQIGQSEVCKVGYAGPANQGLTAGIAYFLSYENLFASRLLASNFSDPAVALALLSDQGVIFPGNKLMPFLQPGLELTLMTYRKDAVKFYEFVNTMMTTKGIVYAVIFTVLYLVILLRLVNVFREEIRLTHGMLNMMPQFVLESNPKVQKQLWERRHIS